MTTIVTAEIGYTDKTTSPETSGTLYLASEAFVTASSDTLANTYFAGRLDGDVSYKLQISTHFWGGKSSVGIGSVEVLNDDGALDGWLDYEFRDKTITLKEHTSGASYNSATTLLQVVIEKLEFSNEHTLRFVIRDPAAELYKPVNDSTYTQASPDTTPEANGTTKPIAFGAPKMCRPVLINESTLAYDAHDTTLLEMQVVYDQGVSVDYLPTSSGLKLLSAPSGKVTCNPLTSGTGTDPTLTESPTEYQISQGGRTLQMFVDGLSPEVSLDYGFADIAETRVSGSGGKYYFEMYIDDIKVWSVGHSVSSWGSGSFGDVGIGIANTAISQPQDPKSSGFYVFTVGMGYTAGTSIAGYYAYSNDVLSDSLNPEIRADSAGDVIGVLVNFDDMQISFERNGSAWDAVCGPWTIASGTYFPVIGTNNKSNGNIASIRLVPDDFTQTIPTGYSAWSDGITANTTFSKLTESISDRVTVTFDSTSVTTVSALAHSSPEVQYTYGYYLSPERSVTPAQILDWAMSSVGGYWFVNRSAQIQVGQLSAPGTSVLTIDDTQIVGDISIEPDYAPGLSNRMGANRNWSPYRESEVTGSQTEAFKQTISREYQDEYRSAVVMADAYDHADGAEMPMSLHIDTTAAQTEADRFASLYSVERYFYRVPIALNSTDFDTVLDDMGLTYTLKSDRFGLSAGLDLVLVGVEGSLLKNELTLTLWGGTSGVGNAVYTPGAVNTNAGDPSSPYYYKKVGGTIGPSDSNTISVVSWVRFRAALSGVYNIASQDGGTSSFDCRFGLSLHDWTDASTGNKVGITMRDSSGNSCTWRNCSVNKTTHGFAYDQWLCFMFSSDISTGVAKLWVGGPNITDTNIYSMTSFAYGGLGIDLDRAQDNWQHGSSASAINAVVSVSDTTWHRTALDFDTESVRRQFIDANGKPVNPGSDGSGCWGFQPDNFMLGGDYSNNIGSMANWTAVGTIPAAADGPGD